MDTIETLMSRRSVRAFSSRPIPEEALQTLLRAGMSGPSCVNARDWAFLVVRDRDTLNRMADANGRPADPLRRAAAGILVCGDLNRAFQGAPDYWIIDGAIAAQNIVLAATSLGIGSVWLGTYPQMERVEGLRDVFRLPEHIIPHSILALGYPDEGALAQRRAEKPYEAERVHWERW